jgi:hypothetical protein
MITDSLSAPAGDNATRDRTVELLALKSGAPLVEVAQLYQTELGALSVGARIGAFLDILVSRRVREILQSRGHPATAT